MATAKRVDLDARQFVVGTLATMVAIRREAEATWIAAGNDITAAVRADWPTGDARSRRAVEGRHTKDGITGAPRRTRKGRLVYEIRVPFPGGFVEFGTRRSARNPILRRRMAEARRRLAAG